MTAVSQTLMLLCSMATFSKDCGSNFDCKNTFQVWKKTVGSDFLVTILYVSHCQAVEPMIFVEPWSGAEHLKKNTAHVCCLNTARYRRYSACDFFMSY